MRCIYDMHVLDKHVLDADLHNYGENVLKVTSLRQILHTVQYRA